MIARYGDIGQFRKKFNAVERARFCRDADNVFNGTAPPLARISAAYGPAETEILVAEFIRDLCEYTGVKSKMSVGQIFDTAAVITGEYGYLTIAEITYFFHLFKAGRFGRFYGSVDALVITNALREFLDVRNAELDRIARERRKAAARIEEGRRRKECLTYEEYEEIRWLFNMGYEKP